MSATRAEVCGWLAGLADGLLELDKDNQAMAAAALGYLEAATPDPAPAEELPPGYLSPHFSLAELTYSATAEAMGLANLPDDDAFAELQALAGTLEGIRTLCGDNPVIISSGYRCSAVNEAVGGASNSAHLYGAAADFTIPAFGSVLDVCHALEPHLAELEIDQLIDESGGGASWVHVGRAPGGGAPRCQCLTINAAGTCEGFA